MDNLPIKNISDIIKMPRKLSAYNIFMKTEIPKVKKENPKISHKEAFKKAASNYKKQKK